MQPIEAILFEPVGCLAEFPADEFNAIAERVFGHAPAAGGSGSEAYWSVLELMSAGSNQLTAEKRALIEDFEIQAVNRVGAYRTSPRHCPS